MHIGPDGFKERAAQPNSAQLPDFADTRPPQDRLIAARKDRMVWRSDWPFPNMSDLTPDLRHPVSLFGDWATDPAMRQLILVVNPARLDRIS